MTATVAFKTAQSRRAAPGVVSCSIHISPIIWRQHESRIEALQRACPRISLRGNHKGDSPRAVKHQRRDDWGCLWQYPGLYLDGQVTEHPLADWAKYAAWQPPDPAALGDRIRAAAAAARAENRQLVAPLEHGFLFLRLMYLRGFANFMIDVAEEEPRLWELCDRVADYWYRVVETYLDAGATRISGGDDLGLQDRLPISPQAWRKLIKPAYARLFGLARARGAEVRLHTDGYIVDIIPDLIEVGVTDLNPQDLVNGLDNLARLAKGRIHISLDVDRQRITAFGTPAEIDDHIRSCIAMLGSPGGGLSLVFDVYPGTPLENIEAVAYAMAKYCDMWAHGGCDA